MSNLNLYVDSEIVTLAKQYAKESDTSISAMFTRFIRGIQAQRETPFNPPINSTLHELSGILHLGEDETIDDLRQKALRKKFNL